MCVLSVQKVTLPLKFTTQNVFRSKVLVIKVADKHFFSLLKNMES